MSLVKPEIAERGIVIVRDIEEPSEIYVDPNRMKEALLNILSNAVQSMTTGGSLTVRTYVRDAEAVIEIKDTGAGITEEDLPFIFDPFFTTKKAGTGLGLTITHRIIEEHKGRIEVESTRGAGSTFRVFMPLNKAMDKK